MPKRDFELRLPRMNAAGTLGFAPNPRGPIDLDRLGAFITNPVSLRARTPAENRGLAPFPGGFLLHTGWPNPGLRAVLRRWPARWAEASLPVVLHLLAGSTGDLAGVAELLEDQENLAALELGLPPQVTQEEAARLVEAAAGELPVIACLPFERAASLAKALAGSRAAAFSLAPPRGALPASRALRQSRNTPLDGTAPLVGTTPAGEVELLAGRLYGPALLPQALAAVQAVAQAGLPVFGAGGVYSPADEAAMLAAGASAVQLDAVLWRDYPQF
jgi:dihydroorotate dehydrogenase